MVPISSFLPKDWFINYSNHDSQESSWTWILFQIWFSPLSLLSLSPVFLLSSLFLGVNKMYQILDPGSNHWNDRGRKSEWKWVRGWTEKIYICFRFFCFDSFLSNLFPSLLSLSFSVTLSSFSPFWFAFLWRQGLKYIYIYIYICRLLEGDEPKMNWHLSVQGSNRN